MGPANNNNAQSSRAGNANQRRNHQLEHQNQKLAWQHYLLREIHLCFSKNPECSMDLQKRCMYLIVGALLSVNTTIHERYSESFAIERMALPNMEEEMWDEC